MASYLGHCQRCSVVISRDDRPWDKAVDVRACEPCRPFVEADLATVAETERQALIDKETAEKKAASAHAAVLVRNAAVAQKAAAAEAEKKAAKPARKAKKK